MPRLGGVVVVVALVRLVCWEGEVVADVLAVWLGWLVGLLLNAWLAWPDTMGPKTQHSF